MDEKINSGGDLPICYIRLNKAEHLLGSLGNLDKYTIVDLEQPKELQDFAGLWRDFIYTDGLSGNGKIGL